MGEWAVTVPHYYKRSIQTYSIHIHDVILYKQFELGTVGIVHLS